MNFLVFIATGTAAAVEWVEALTIVLAVGLFKGWRNAWVGTVVATAALAIIVAAFGFTITAYVSIVLARTLVGFFLLLFGVRWLAKSVLRASGLKALHDEAKAFEETKEQLEASNSRGWMNLDRVGVSTAFGGVFLEGLEVVFIVVALGGTGGVHNLEGAVLGATAALMLVIAVGVAARAPLTRVPENWMKFTVGIMLSAFGTYFVGEGVGVKWWHEDLVLLPLIGGYLLVAIAVIWLLRRPRRARYVQSSPERAVRAVVGELWGLLIGDGAIAIAVVAVVCVIAIYILKVPASAQIAGLLLAIGVVAAVLMGVWESASKRPVVEEPTMLAGVPSDSAEAEERASQTAVP